ncbi:MAG: putative RDD family membrane protein YckC [Planctomycetota bacterium]
MKAVDLALPIETPEGSTLMLRPAGVAVRGAAWVIDSMLRLGIYMLVSTVMALLGEAGQGPLLIVVFFGEWLYFALFEAYMGGATPGKKRMGIYVVEHDGGPVGLEAALVRNLVRFVDTLPLFYGFGLMSCLSSPDFQRLGDRVAGTMVVHTGNPRRKLLKLIAKTKAVSAPGPLRPMQPLTGREAALVLAFEERQDSLHPERQVEIANLLEPLTGLRGTAGVERLRAHAAWLETRE